MTIDSADIRIVGLDEVRTSRVNPVGLLYDVHFALSAEAPAGWPLIATARFARHGIAGRRAWAESQSVVVRCRIDEVERVLSALRPALESANDEYRARNAAQERARLIGEAFDRGERQKLRGLAARLTFDRGLLTGPAQRIGDPTDNQYDPDGPAAVPGSTRPLGEMVMTTTLKFGSTGEPRDRSCPNPREVQDAQTAFDGGRCPGPWADAGRDSSPRAADGSTFDRRENGGSNGEFEDLTPTADELAARAVSLADNGGLVLTAPGVAPVLLGPCPNPALAKERLTAVRRFASALISTANSGARTCDAPVRPTGHRSATASTDGGYPADSDLHQMSDDGGPVGPDPARWTDPIWQDQVGEQCTSDDDTPTGSTSNPAGGAGCHPLIRRE